MTEAEWELEFKKFIRDSRNIGMDKRTRILVRDGCRCQYCGTQEDLQIDHLMPINSPFGGDKADTNLQVLCRKCNHQKGDNMPTFKQMERLTKRALVFNKGRHL